MTRQSRCQHLVDSTPVHINHLKLPPIELHMLAHMRDPRQQVEYQAGQRAVIPFWNIPEAERLAQIVDRQHTI